ncbi:hypothetical protein SUGI_0728690 [Cryptomeria japonica]|nr:hypothetical protein SUGI_0728690 [Cryptomeria japonica]
MANKKVSLVYMVAILSLLNLTFSSTAMPLARNGNHNRRSLPGGSTCLDVQNCAICEALFQRGTCNTPDDGITWRCCCTSGCPPLGLV